jgi:hypothetical protein
MPRPKRPALKRRLTELSVRKLKPKTTSYVIWDTLQRNLAIRVQPTGARAWKVIYSYHGRPRWLHLGDAGAIGLADARMLAQEAMLAVARGKDPAAEKRAERGAGTFGDCTASTSNGMPSDATGAGGRPTRWCGGMPIRVGPSCKRRRSAGPMSAP